MSIIQNFVKIIETLLLIFKFLEIFDKFFMIPLTLSWFLYHFCPFLRIFFNFFDLFLLAYFFNFLPICIFEIHVLINHLHFLFTLSQFHQVDPWLFNFLRFWSLVYQRVQFFNLSLIFVVLFLQHFLLEFLRDAVDTY